MIHRNLAPNHLLARIAAVQYPTMCFNDTFAHTIKVADIPAFYALSSASQQALDWHMHGRHPETRLGAKSVFCPDCGRIILALSLPEDVSRSSVCNLCNGSYRGRISK